MARPASESDQAVHTADDTPPIVIIIGDAATLTRGGQGSSIEDKRYPYG